MPAAWARHVRDQCRAARVPLFMKRMSRRETHPWSADTRVPRFL